MRKIAVSSSSVMQKIAVSPVEASLYINGIDSNIFLFA